MNKQSYQSKSSECPTVHGWTIIGHNEHLGCIVYEFGDRARMRRIVESDGLEDNWIAFVDGECYGTFATVEEMTAEVKAELSITIPFNRQALHERSE